MPDDNDTNACPPSTTWSWKTVRVASAPQATSTARRRRSPFGHLRPYPRRERLTVYVTYRGGPECWYELEARGVVVRRPGVLALHDVLREMYADGS